MYEVVITDMETGKRQAFKCDVVLCVTTKATETFGILVDGAIKGPTTLKDANKLWKGFYKSLKKQEKEALKKELDRLWDEQKKE